MENGSGQNSAVRLLIGQCPVFVSGPLVDTNNYLETDTIDNVCAWVR